MLIIIILSPGFYNLLLFRLGDQWQNEGIGLAISLRKQTENRAKHLIFIQLLAVIIMVVLFALFSLHAAFSALIAGGICVSANFLFIKHLFREINPHVVKRIMINFIVGEVIKLALIVLAMVLVIYLLPITVLPFLLTYVILQFVLLFAPLCYRRGY